MNKTIYVVSSSVVALSMFTTGQAQEVQASELGTTGVKMPVVSTIGEYSDNKIVLTNTGNGTQYLSEYGDVTIRDMVTGNVLRTVFKNMTNVTVNDAEDLFIGVNKKVYSATKFDSATEFDNSLRLERVYGFLLHTNTFVGRSGKKLIAYDYDTKQQVFEVTMGSDDNLYAVKKDIAVANGNNITIYDSKGNYVDVLQFDSEVTAIKYDPSGTTLLVGTKNADVQVFDAANNYALKQTTLFQNTKYATDFSYDPTGDYLAVALKVDNYYNYYSYPRVYNLAAQKRIYTELDNTSYYIYYGPIMLSPGAKFINIAGTTYNAKNFIKTPVSINVPTQYLTVQADNEVKPNVTVTLLDGSKENVTDGVTWKSDDLSVGYFDENSKTFKFASEGTFTLRASYLDFVKDVEVEVERSWRSDIADYIKKNTKNGYYIDSMNVKDIYLDQRVYNGVKYKGQYVVTTFTGKKNGAPITYLDVARKGKSAIAFKKVEITANGKTLKKATKTYLNAGYERTSYIKLSASDRKWIKANVDPNKAVTAKLTGGKKTVTIKLSKVQRDALLKGVLVNDYLQ